MASRLPALREDLQLFPAAAELDGSPSWMIQDPVTNRFFRIGWLEFELLCRWDLGEPNRVLQSLSAETPLSATSHDLDALVGFFRGHQLLRAADAESVDGLRGMAKHLQGSRASWLLHNYLFLRIPLIRPQRFLQAAAPVLNLIWSQQMLMVAAACAFVGLILVARQWDSFMHTFTDFISPAGVLGYACALIVAKTVHELGHAAVATRYGVRVAHMGVAILVLAPILYTDTSESWKLADRRQRFRIAAAGIASEFALAGFATLAWSLVSDGALRSALFFLATTSWILALAFNASPFIRLDGYFLLSDVLDMQNLHSRSFALARAWLRRFVLGWDEPDPEHLPPTRRRWLVVFALTTWLFRLIGFLGIALLVYHWFIKIVGLFLFAVELVYFILRPVWSEMKVWLEGRSRTPPRRRVLLAGIGVAMLLFLAWPWARDVRGEGWLHVEQQQLIYSPFPARVVSLHSPGEIKAGETLIALDSPDTRSKATQSRILADALSLQIDQSIGRLDGAEKRALLAEQLAQQHAETSAQQAELQRLTLAAPFTGRLVDVDHDIKPGVWIGANQLVGILVDPSSWVIDALVEQHSVDRVKPGAKVRFYRRNHAGAPLVGEVLSVDSARAQVLPHPMLSTTQGGRIPASVQAGGMLTPRDALYRVRVRLLGDADGFKSVAPGAVLIAGEPRSLLAEMWTTVVSVLVRESGF